MQAGLFASRIRRKEIKMIEKQQSETQGKKSKYSKAYLAFYTALVFSPREMAENLKKSGAFVPGIRPGEQTSNYLEKVVMRLTFFGALYITIICLIPEFVTGVLGIPFHLGGTSLLILVVVTMDFGTQVASYRMNQQYEHLMRKNSVKK